MLLHYPVRATASIPNSLGMHLCIETTRPQHPIVRVSPCTLHMALAIFRSLFVDREVGVSDDEIFCTVPRISARKRVCVNTLVVDNTLYRYTYASPSRETHSGRTCTIAIVFGTALVTHCGHASAPVYQATSGRAISHASAASDARVARFVPVNSAKFALHAERCFVAARLAPGQGVPQFCQRKLVRLRASAASVQPRVRRVCNAPQFLHVQPAAKMQLNLQTSCLQFCVEALIRCPSASEPQAFEGTANVICAMPVNNEQ